MSRKNVPFSYGEPSGPRMVATQSYMLSSSFGPALQYRGGSRLISASSCPIRLALPASAPPPVFFQFHLLPWLFFFLFWCWVSVAFFCLSFLCFFWRSSWGRSASPARVEPSRGEAAAAEEAAAAPLATAEEEAPSGAGDAAPAG